MSTQALTLEMLNILRRIVQTPGSGATGYVISEQDMHAARHAVALANESLQHPFNLHTASEGEVHNGKRVHKACGCKEELGDTACLTCGTSFMHPANVAKHCVTEGQHVLAFYCWACDRYETAQRGGEQ